MVQTDKKTDDELKFGQDTEWEESELDNKIEV